MIGAVAYDLIGSTDSDLSNVTHNCKLTNLQEEFGGCGGNIAYNLARLGTQCALVSGVGGNDFEGYKAHLTQAGVALSVIEYDAQPCARAMIVTDPKNHQFTAFFAGPDLSGDELDAMVQRQKNCQFTVIAPFPVHLMRAAMRSSQLHQPQSLRIWSPGQYADSLNLDDIRHLSHCADWIVGNAHEISHLRESVEMSDKTVITTNGSEPVTVDHDGKTVEIPVSPVALPIDPTGCGDAFIAGVINECLQSDFKEITAAAIASGIRIAQKCLTHNGSQQHT